jgi:hypothetical protein
MNDLARHPKLRQLARNLHIPDNGDCLRELRDHAIATVHTMLTQWTVDTIEELRLLVADRLNVKLEFLHTDEDVERVASTYAHVTGHFRRLLRAEFLKSDTEGLLIDNPKPGKDGRDYLAIIDARGPRKTRAYFTAWHELAHLLLYPPRQLVLEGCRRTPTEDVKRKDPVESAVDHIAGLLAFWEPLFTPALHASEDLTFDAIERATTEVAPGASLYAASLAAIRSWSGPAAFLTAEIATKKDGTSPSLRVMTIIPNDRARNLECRVHKHMRVPATSALHRAFHDRFGRTHAALENQSWWEVSDRGPLPALDWHVQAVRRGPAVYGLLTAMTTMPIPVPKTAHLLRGAAR